ncbi:anti-sigma factor antagonist [Umezawaea tangerina]|uniref:Anti-sigma factor antagonist n=1 Tax=Umezawaea tangerina TaxID=84725 RepID=A0A2T0SK36_9PSEU|nr:anti-sigma factor antagonist [Umezawaea tangerina]PRY33778.1 anti-sigma B factor antagonist [Umezawaea tangerina]
MTVQDPNVAEANRDEQAIGLAVSNPAQDVTVVSVSGEVDMVSAPALRAGVTANLVDGGKLVLDLTGVSFLGSAGLAVLVEAAQQSRSRAIAFSVVAADRAVTRPIAATGLGEVFDVHPTLDEAIG